MSSLEGISDTLSKKLFSKLLRLKSHPRVLSCVDGFVHARFFRLMLIVTKSGHVSGLLARYTLPLALMESAYRAPHQTHDL